jgi:hypothetical protein
VACRQGISLVDTIRCPWFDRTGRAALGVGARRVEIENPLEAKEHLEELAHHHEHGGQGWTRYLAITTALIAVLAAVASLLAGNWANTALLRKNDALLAQTQASDQFAYYQAKGIKKALAEFEFAATKGPAQQAQADKYGQEQQTIKAAADEDTKKVTEQNEAAEAQLEKHHHGALAVTLFQIAIALSAMSALLRRKSFWALSVGLATAGSVFLGMGIHG